MFRYDAPTDTFTGPVNTQGSSETIATDHDGSVTMNSSGLVFDGDFNLAGTVPCRGSGVAVNGAGTLGYALNTSGVAVCDLIRFDQVRFFPQELPQVGRLTATADGRLLVGITQTGVVLVTP